MAEEIKTQETQAQETLEKKPEDLITRVSQVKTVEGKKIEKSDKFNINDLDSEIEKVQDPAVKEQFVGLKKSLLKGENQKYEEIANLRKQYEQELAQVTTNWTPERIKAEMAKPDFVQAAQQVLQSGNQHGLTDEEFSALSVEEKKELTQLKQKISSLERSNWETLKLQQDAQLRTKYANYDPEAVDKLTDDLMRGKLQATREHLYKVLDYENAVKRAYELGLIDKQTTNQEKANGMTFAEGRNMATEPVIERQKDESAQNFMKRSYAEHSKKK